MATQPDNARSSRGVWTIVIVFGIIFAVFAVLATVLVSAMQAPPLGENAIGVVTIDGPILSAENALDDLRYFDNHDEVVGIVVRIDSPGGSVGASQEIFEALQRIDKPIVISMGNVAASGGFYIAMAGPRVFASPGTITGSIGVISQSVEIDDLMEYLQIEMNVVTSGEYKDSGSPFRDFTDKDRRHYEDLVMDLYLQFVEVVAQARSMPREEAAKWADGRVFTGRQAHAAGLIDELGGFEVALAWLMDDVGVDGKPNLVEPPAHDDGIVGMLLGKGAQQVEQSIRAASAPSFEYRYAGPTF